MRLSIIIPIYNVEKYLSQCLESVLIQDLTQCEIICVNDGSTDNSKNILADYKSKFPKLIIIDKQNAGLSDARNVGLLSAIGEYIYFLDSDDYLLNDAVSKMLSYICDKNLDIACFNVLKDGPESYFKQVFFIDGIITGTEFCNLFFNSNGFCYPAPVWMYLYRHKFLVDNQLCFAKVRFHEDEEFTPRALYLSQKVSFCDTPILFHRLFREGAITSSITIKHLADSTEIARILFQFFNSQKSEVDSIFYHAIYLLYFITLMKSVEENLVNYKSKYITKQDFQIMKKCSQNEFQLRCAKLSSINISIFYKFQNNTINIILRKMINRFL